MDDLTVTIASSRVTSPDRTFVKRIRPSETLRMIKFAQNVINLQKTADHFHLGVTQSNVV
jgi:hypothetical protein